MGGRSGPPCLQPGRISQEGIITMPQMAAPGTQPSWDCRAEQQHRLPASNLHSDSAHCQELRLYRFTSEMQKHCFLSSQTLLLSCYPLTSVTQRHDFPGRLVHKEKNISNLATSKHSPVTKPQHLLSSSLPVKASYFNNPRHCAYGLLAKSMLLKKMDAYFTIFFSILGLSDTVFN